MAKPDGGPAFPRLESLTHHGASTKRYVAGSIGGMSLRDYFAGQAMALRWPPYALSIDKQGFVNCEDAATIAANCYAIADAMLAARNEE